MKVENPHSELNFSAPLVLGCGVSGRAAAYFLRAQGGKVTIAEKSLTYVQQEYAHWQGEHINLLHENDLHPLASYSLIVTSPGLPQEHAVLREAQRCGVRVIGEMELGLRFLRARAIGITGTNGKTSVTSLTHHVLHTCGMSCHAVGNIGVPLTEALLKLPPLQATQDLFIIEMSSFQLEGLCVPSLEQGVILNLTPNHLDRHGTMDAYTRAKCCIAACMQPGGTLYAHPQILQDSSLLQAANTKPLSPHVDPFIENATTAWTLCKAYGVDQECFTKSAASWKPPGHRMAFVREKNGVRYYNDSKASNLAAVEKAIQCIPGPILLLAGGVHKGASYHPWIRVFEGKVRHLFLFGQAALQIEEELGMFFPVTQTASLQAALYAAVSEARYGEAIVLSPGCSSYDMFRDYIHRGESFEKWVKEL